MHRLYLLSIFLFTLFSCNKENPKAYPLQYSNDMDESAGWFENPSIVRFNAHSGYYVCKMDRQYPYSLSFKRKLSEISPKPILRAQVNAWVYVNSMNAKGNIVCAIDSIPGKAYIYFSESISEKMNKEKTWIKVSSVFYFPNVLTPDFIFSAYLWNSGPEDIFVDDIQVELTEY